MNLWSPRLLVGALSLFTALQASRALGQAPFASCGAPPAPIVGAIAFQDITTRVGYQVLAKPTADTLSDYLGGFEDSCQVGENFEQGPWATPHLAGTITVPFPFGFSGIYSDGGQGAPPIQLNVWANGLLTFDSTVSFDPFVYPPQNTPPGCSGSNGTTNYIVDNGSVSDTFGGFPFLPRYKTPNALIAPWWGDLSLCPRNGSVGSLLTLDDSGGPLLIVQWTDATASAAPPNCGQDCFGMIDFSSCTNPDGQPLYPGASLPQFTFQVRLHSNNDVDFVYGPSSNLSKTGSCYTRAVGSCNYISGIQSNLPFAGGIRNPLLDYAVMSFPCPNSDPVGCYQSQFPAVGTSVTYRDVFRSVGPDLQVVSIAPPGLLPLGGTFTVPLQLSNGGGTDSTGEGQVQFYFSPGGQTPQGTPFSLQPVTSVRACETLAFNAQVTLPSTISQSAGYLIAEFIPGAESADPIHSFANAPVIIGPPEADLGVQGGLDFTPATILDGQLLTVTFGVTNVGQVDAPATSCGIYLSRGGTISISDVEVGTGPIPPLAVGQSAQISVPVTLPLTLASSDYFIGAIVNPDNAFPEINQANNTSLGNKLLIVTSLGPVIGTSSFPKAQVDSPYSVQLIAGGGDGNYFWSLAGGALPGGLALTRTGAIHGQAESAGTSLFTVKVTDGAGRSALGALSIEVDPFDQPLSIETLNLPEASTGQLYKFNLAAGGGTPPYQWSLVPETGELPIGISLSSDGTLVGQPQYDGQSTFKLAVKDAAGSSATSSTYALVVYSGGTLGVGTTLLAAGTVGTNYSALLRGAGGTAPYSWGLVEVMRESAGPGDPGSDLGPNLPAGLQWFPDEGQIEGLPTQVGVYALTVQVVDSESPPAHAQALVLMTISAKTSFSFETVQLPAAQANAPYRTSLSTNAPPSAFVTYQTLDVGQLPTGKGHSMLPPGLVLFVDGRIEGVPLAAGDFSFLIAAQDGQGGVAAQSFSIHVENSAVSTGGGCQEAAGAPALLALGLVALVAIRRRRHP